jgi:hypothetical protein
VPRNSHSPLTFPGTRSTAGHRLQVEYTEVYSEAVHMAARFGISTNAVKTHRELLFDKLQVSTRAEAVTAAARMGLLSL